MRRALRWSFATKAVATSLFINVPTGAAAEAVVVPTQSAQREASLEPEPAEPKIPGRATFDIDPIADGAIIGISAGFAIVLDQLKSTGEIRPQQISRDFDRNNLLAIDRPVVTATHHASAGMWSNVGSAAAMVYAIVDPVLSGYREQSLQTGLVDLMLYAETLALTQATTNLVKLAVRRPRPAAYRDAEVNRDDPDYSNAETDSALSFFSGHASTTASLSDRDVPRVRPLTVVVAPLGDAPGGDGSHHLRVGRTRARRQTLSNRRHRWRHRRRRHRRHRSSSSSHRRGQTASRLGRLCSRP